MFRCVGNVQTLLLIIFADGEPRVSPFLIVNGAEGEEGEMRKPAWWGTQRTVKLLKGTMMEKAAIALQKNAYMTNKPVLLVGEGRLHPRGGVQRRCAQGNCLDCVRGA